ncbi:hypothetical protein L7F22_049182 [Adiantum nelumboides]|nr:hypothetical protein [Adiantum nelumboides]
MVLLQVDYEKAFHRVQWDFLAGILHKMGFGPKVVHCIFMLGKDAWSRLLVNGRMSNKVHVGQLVRQECPLSPLLFAVATRPFFSYLDSYAKPHIVQGFSIGRGQMLGQGFADDTFVFLKANNVNVLRCMAALGKFFVASGLHINMLKSSFIDVSAIDFNALIWGRKRLPKGHIFRYLGYPIGVHVTPADLQAWEVLITWYMLPPELRKAGNDQGKPSHLDWLKPVVPDAAFCEAVKLLHSTMEQTLGADEQVQKLSVPECAVEDDSQKDLLEVVITKVKDVTTVMDIEVALTDVHVVLIANDVKASFVL